MSKTLPLVIGAVVVVAAATTGMAWYTGTQVEPLLRQQVDDINQGFKAAVAGSPIRGKLEMTGFERHLFSSTAHYLATVQSPDLNGGQPLQLDTLAEIEHGPFPWSRVRQLKLLPVLASAHYQAQPSAQLAQALGVAEGQAPVEAYATVGYDRTLDGRLTALPLQWQGSQGNLKLSGLEATTQRTLDGQKMTLDVRADSLEFTSTDPEAPMLMQVQGLSAHSGGIKGESGFYLGDSQMQAARVSFSAPGKPAFEVQKLAGVGSLEEREGKLKGSVDYHFDLASIDAKPIGSGQMRWLFDNLDIAASRELTALYQNVIVPQAQAHVASGSTEPFQAQLTPEQEAQLQLSLQHLLAGHPHVELQPLGLKTANGESHLSLALDLTWPDSLATLDPNLLAQTLAPQMVAGLDFKLSLAKGTVRDLVTLQGQLSGQGDPATLAQNAEGAATMVTTMATLQGLAKAEGDNVLTSLHYENGMVDFNGRKMTVQEFSAFVMAALGQQR